jgi:DNA-binding response OmpR family regulator
MNKTILVIDDDDVLRASLATGLRTAGFNVVTADGAETGAHILERIAVDAIVLDRMMTGMDGLTFLQNLRDLGDTTPVLMLTAMSGVENTIAGLDGGADDYLAKPFQLQELVLRLKNILRLKRESGVALPNGLAFVENEFYIKDKLFAMSDAEKTLLRALISPVGATAVATPMVAKRLREKLVKFLPDMDLITMRGRGYKIIIKQDR